MSKFWNKKRVLITGANGFVGANLAKRLMEEGAEVVTFTRGKIKKPSLLALEKLVGKIYKQEKGSVKDFETVNKVIKRNKVEVVFHLAAQPIVEVGEESPIETFEVNVKGTWNVLEAARQNKVKKVIVASSTHVYGDNPNLPYKEEYYPQPSRPYETSKACADLLAQSFADTYGLPVEVPRFVNLYGPGDTNMTRLVPKLIESVIEGKNPVMWDFGAVRDYLYIDDAVDAYLALVEKKLLEKKRIRVFNIGSGKPIKVVNLAKKIVKLSDSKKLKLTIKKPPAIREKEIKKQYVSVVKAEFLLSWKPKTKLLYGLKQTTDWYKKYKKEVLI